MTVGQGTILLSGNSTTFQEAGATQPAIERRPWPGVEDLCDGESRKLKPPRNTRRIKLGPLDLRGKLPSVLSWTLRVES